MCLIAFKLLFQVTELEAEFEKLPNQKAQQNRFLRSQQDLKAKMEEQAAAGGGDGNAEDGNYKHKGPIGFWNPH